MERSQREQRSRGRENQRKLQGYAKGKGAGDRRETEGVREAYIQGQQKIIEKA